MFVASLSYSQAVNNSERQPTYKLNEWGGWFCERGARYLFEKR